MTLCAVKSAESPKFYIIQTNFQNFKVFRGRRLTVGCPVVVSPLPREWSYVYRRCQLEISFLNGQKYFGLDQPAKSTVSRYRATATFHLNWS